MADTKKPKAPKAPGKSVNIKPNQKEKGQLDDAELDGVGGAGCGCGGMAQDPAGYNKLKT